MDLRPQHPRPFDPPRDPRRRRVARTSLIVFGLVVAGLLCTSCFGGGSPQRIYYTIQYPQAQLWSYEQPRYPLEVRVQRIDAPPSYDRQEMVYRSNPHEFRYYHYRLWSAKPDKMLRELVQRHLRATNLFKNVTLEIEASLPDYNLETEIIALEELNADEETWFAHLAMRFTLVRFRDGARVWEYDFDRRKEVYNREPVYVVRAMSELAEEEISKAFADLDAFLAEKTGAPAPPGGPGARPKAVAKESDDADDGGKARDSRDSEDGEDTGSDSGKKTPKATLKKRRP